MKEFLYVIRNTLIFTKLLPQRQKLPHKAKLTTALTFHGTFSNFIDFILHFSFGRTFKI